MDVAAALLSLDLAREDDVPDLSWLTASHDDPATFWAALAEHVRRIAPVPRSKPGVAYDLYYDAVGRHATTARTAFVAYDRRAGWKSLSYAELGARAAVCAGAWANLGLAAGAPVAIVLPLGVPWLVAFAAALRLGLIVSFLDPAGDRALIPRLDALAPARVIVDLEAPAPIGPWAEKAATVPDRGAPHTGPPHAYAPEEPCGKLFSPVRLPLLKPTPLLAEIAWQNASRDAVFAYRLGPADTLALPGFHPQQTHPAAIFAAMLAGATFLHVSMADLAARPSLLYEQPITTLGIAPALRDALRAGAPGKLPPIAQWVKSVDEPLDWPAWREFVVKSQLLKVMTANVLIDAAAGGAVLFSTRRPGSINAYVLPSAGRPYLLVDAASGEPASGAGVFVPKPGDPKKDGWFLLAKRGAEFLWGSTLAPRRAGRVFPATEVEGFVATLKGVLGGATVAVPAGDPAGRWDFVLIAFVGAAGGAGEGAIDAAIRARLSTDHVPDRVVTVPLYPRKKGEKVDVEWCRRQFASGFLAKKAAHPAFQSLAALRGLLGA